MNINRREILVSGTSLLSGMAVGRLGWASTDTGATSGSKPGGNGRLRSDILAKIRPAMLDLVTTRRIAGAVTLIAQHGEVIHLAAVGQADIEAHRKMRPNSVFWLASQAKPTTSTSLMVLVDEGKVDLDAPVSRYLPVFKNARLRTGPLQREIIVRQLLSHTAGLAQPPRNPNDGAIPLRAYAEQLLGRPLEFEPGSAYEYGYGLTVAGAIVEVVSGKPFDSFLDERVFGPLGMNDTTFHPNEEQRRRLAKTYQPGSNAGSIVPAYNPFITQDATVRRTPEPSGGLFSTAPDMARFYQMVLNGGELDGKRILSPAAVRTMLEPQSAGGKPLTYALGWQHFRQPGTGSAPELVGYGHGGAFGTDGLVIPSRGIVAVMMIQRCLFPNGGDVSGTFRGLLAESIPVG